MDAIGGNSVSFNEQKFHLGDKTIDKKEMAKAMTELANAGDKEASAIVEQFGSVKELYEAIQNRTEVAMGNSTKMAVGKAVANLFSNLPAEVFKPKPLSKGKWIIKTKALKEACRGNTFNCNKIQTKINNLRAKVGQLKERKEHEYPLYDFYQKKSKEISNSGSKEKNLLGLVESMGRHKNHGTQNILDKLGKIEKLIGEYRNSGGSFESFSKSYYCERENRSSAKFQSPDEVECVLNYIDQFIESASKVLT